MKRTIVTIISTVVGLVLLLQFKTHPLGANASGGLASLGTVPATSSSPRVKASHHKPVHHTSSTRPSTSGAQSSPVPKKTPPASKTVTGRTIQTRYGPVQVRITETSGQLTDVEAVQLPGGDPHSSQIAAYAAPLLRSEALKADSAHIDIVSGATYTSDGYAQSLQSALDNA